MKKEQQEYCVLRLRDGDVLVDFADLPLLDLANIHWGITNKNGKLYAVAHITRDGYSRNISMHRLLMWFPEETVDRINRNTLDNRRANLRVLSPQKNWANSGPRKNGKIQYKGVSLHSRSGKFRATIQTYGKWRQLGLFKTPEEAARAYDIAAFEAYGDAAYLNRNEFDL